MADRLQQCRSRCLGDIGDYVKADLSAHVCSREFKQRILDFSALVEKHMSATVTPEQWQSLGGRLKPVDFTPSVTMGCKKNAFDDNAMRHTRLIVAGQQLAYACLGADRIGAGAERNAIVNAVTQMNAQYGKISPDTLSPGCDAVLAARANAGSWEIRSDTYAITTAPRSLEPMRTAREDYILRSTVAINAADASRLMAIMPAAVAPDGAGQQQHQQLLQQPLLLLQQQQHNDEEENLQEEEEDLLDIEPADEFEDLQETASTNSDDMNELLLMEGM